MANERIMKEIIEKIKNNKAANVIGVIFFWCVVAGIAWLIFSYHIFGHNNKHTNANNPEKMSIVNVNEVVNTINAFRENSNVRQLTSFALLSKMAQSQLTSMYTCGIGNNCGPGIDFNNVFNKDVGNPNGILSVLEAPTISAGGAVDYWLANKMDTFLDPQDYLIGVSSTAVASQPELVVMLYNPN